MVSPLTANLVLVRVLKTVSTLREPDVVSLLVAILALFHILRMVSTVS